MLFQPAWAILVKLSEINMTPLISLSKIQRFITGKNFSYIIYKYMIIDIITGKDQRENVQIIICNVIIQFLHCLMYFSWWDLYQPLQRIWKNLTKNVSLWNLTSIYNVFLILIFQIAFVFIFSLSRLSNVSIFLWYVYVLMYVFSWKDVC